MDKVEVQALLIGIAGAVAGLIIAVSTGLKKVVDAYFERAAKQMMQKRYINGMHAVAQFHKIIEEFRKLDHVDRVLLFRGSNCGGTPDPKRPYNVRCFFGWSKDPSKHPEESYNFDLVVDAHYMSKLMDVATRGKSVQITEQIPDTARLKSYYVAEGVVASHIYFLSLDNNEMMYVSIASYKADFTKAQVMAIDLIVDRARACLISTNGTNEHNKLF